MIELFDRNFQQRGDKVIIKHSAFKDKNGMIGVFVHWCGHCVAFKPTYEEVANITGNVYPMAVINPDKNPKAMKMLGVLGYPTVFYINQGIVGDLYQGERTKTGMMQNICKHSRQSHGFCHK
jgi:thioredoxin-like negative regulator of GroEL